MTVTEGFQEVLDAQKRTWKEEHEVTIAAATPIAAAIIADLEKKIAALQEKGKKIQLATEWYDGDFSSTKIETLNQVYTWLRNKGLYVDRGNVSENFSDLEYVNLSGVIMNSDNEPVQVVGAFHKTARALSYQRRFACWVAQQWPDEYPARYRIHLVLLTSGDSPRFTRSRLT